MEKNKIDNLKHLAEHWKEMLIKAIEHRDFLLQAQSMGVCLNDGAGINVLSQKINAADDAVREYERCLILTESELGRTQSGEHG